MATAEHQNSNSLPDLTEDRDGKSRYVIFKKVAEDTWKELGTLEADGAYLAREHAVLEYDLMEEARQGELEIVSLGARFWSPKKPKVSISESLDVS